ncbi:hypothetical protein [Burkholderia ubonensis]|uniref:hypothetical protein n=1 Tax=Burkholderia ubonensis TaxID=101571 RepID=UPI00075914D8|nr:hypothetical protein [Burkholderia ubonensis]KVZ10956.1 hypothetical protein WL11_04075 [Burkholderia ubonensis]
MIDAPLGDYRARHVVARVADGPTGGSGNLAFANAEDSATGAQSRGAPDDAAHARPGLSDGAIRYVAPVLLTPRATPDRER